MDELIIVIVVVVGIIQIALFVRIWMMTNDVREIKKMYQSQISELKSTTEENNATEENKDPRREFKKGDLVLIIENESQFRITEIIEENGTIYYSSVGTPGKYKENELEFFNVYWDNKQ